MLDGQDDKAELYFKKVLELTSKAQYSQVDERRENALYNLGVITLAQQKYEEAAGYFKEALRIRKDASDTYLNLARALKGLGDYDSAVKNLEFAIAFDPSFAEAHYTLGQVYEAKGDKVNASYYYYQAARLSPESEVPQEALASFGTSAEWVARAKTQLESGSPDDALDSALIASNLDPENVDAIKMHAEVLLARKNYKDALEVYRKALKIDAKNAAVLAAVAQIESEHPREALAAYQAALKGEPDNKELKSTIARLKKAAKQ
jgi:tetratricopeptide (TPR) repeat protein